MKILSVNVVSFGKLSNVNLTFNNSVNVVQNVNGFGKTTLANFIRAMFYGLNYNYSKVGEDRVNDVARFRPWNSTERFGGSITIESDGRNYRIERFFGTTSRQETLSVIDLGSGSLLNVTNVGEHFLGLTAESYDRSTYVPQEFVEISSNENINTRLSNALQNNGAAFEQVMGRLREYKKSFKFERGNGGKIYDLKNKRDNLLQQLAISKTRLQQKAANESRLQTAENEQHALRSKKQELLQTINSAQDEISRNKPTERDIATEEKYKELKLKLAALSTFDADYDNLTRCGTEAEQEAAKPQVSSRGKTVLMVIAIILMVCGGVLAIPVMPLGVALASVGLVGFVVSLVIRPQPTQAAKRKNELLDAYFDLAQRYVSCEGYDYYAVKRALAEKHAAFVADTNTCQALQSMITPRVSTAEAEKALNNAMRELDATESRIDYLVSECGRLRNAIDGVVDDRSDLEDAVLNVENEIAAAEHSFEVADILSKLLTQANENLSRSYLPKLCNRTSELLRFVTQGNYSVSLDTEFTIRIQQNGQTNGMFAFSRGIREITLLCFRIALSELLYDGNVPFMIIDDAMVNFDEENFARCVKLLRKLSSKTQILYLTCHDRSNALR